MSDLKVFRLRDGDVVELAGVPPALDGALQRLVEANLETLFGVRLLASGYATGSRHGGRVATVGLDENASPVVIEYQRAGGGSVINQGVWALDWLVDHRADVTLLAMDRLGASEAASIDWRSPRLVCLAPGFSRNDEHVVHQINRSIELVRFRLCDDELLALELVSPARPNVSGNHVCGNHVSGNHVSGRAASRSAAHGHPAPRTIGDDLAVAPAPVHEVYAALEQFVGGLGEDVTRTQLASYIAFRRLRNFTCVEVDLREGELLLYLRLDPDTVQLEDGFTRDVRRLGHVGTGLLEVRVPDGRTLTRALPLVRASYANG
jgi:predicted transport protein